MSQTRTPIETITFCIRMMQVAMDDQQYRTDVGIPQHLLPEHADTFFNGVVMGLDMALDAINAVVALGQHDFVYEDLNAILALMIHANEPAQS